MGNIGAIDRNAPHKPRLVGGELHLTLDEGFRLGEGDPARPYRRSVT